MTDNFAGVTYFFFSTPTALSPGITYFFEPVVQSGDLWNIDSAEYNYPGGTGFNNGLPVGASDLWFREGIVVPEPSSVLLILMGSRNHHMATPPFRLISCEKHVLYPRCSSNTRSFSGFHY